MRAGTNLPAIGGYNQVVILDVIRRATDGISRVEVAERTGLSAQTATNVCRRLLLDGLIHETGTRSGGVGKPRRILELKADGRFAIGIHLDPSVLTVVLLDLSGAVVSHKSFPTLADTSVDEIVDRIASAIDEIVAASAIDPGRILGAGVAAPGPIDLASGIVLNPPLLVGWDRVPVREMLSTRLKMPVLLEKDVTAAAVAESWTGTKGNNFAFFYYGTGVGAGFSLQNDVLRGSSGNAGEVGNLVVGGGGPSHPVPGRWRLGDAVLPRNVVGRALAGGVVQASGDWLDSAEVQRAFDDFAARAREGDPTALVIVDEIASDIAEGLVSIIDVLDVDRIVFGGPFWYPLAPLLLERVPALVSRSRFLVPPHPISFEEATVGQDVAATGAACLVLDHALTPRPSTLLISHSDD
ncbi:ROK family transcriptional regulator [Glaciihabitans sp. UYNi722]|uniref:ROK family transcriptional regulator n=1 Tax=Glaciihabitans sp. UYNi722 TaxID=3156344 RepID=UPI00339A170F